MAYGSLGPGQFLIWEVGLPGRRTKPSQFCTCAFSASVSPFSKLKEMTDFFLVPPPPSLTLIVAKHPRTLHSFPRWGSAISAEGERLGPCQEDV